MRETLIQRRLLVVSLSAPCVASLLVLGVNPAGIAELLIYALYYCLAVIPISLSASRWLLKDYQLNCFERIVLGYPMAVTAMAAAFALFKTLGLPQFILILPTAGLISMAQGWEGHKKAAERQLTSGSTLSLLGIYALSALLLFLIFTLTSREPTVEFGSNVYEDTLWTIGNTWSVLRGGLPLEDSRFSGVTLSYHIAQNLYYASTSWLTGINPIELHLRIAPFYDLFFLAGAISIGARVFWKIKALPSTLICLPILFSNAQITPLKVGGDPGLGEIFSNPISLVFGLGAFLLSLIALSTQKRAKALWRDLAYIGILFTLCMSSKGILGVLLLAAYTIYIAIDCLDKKRPPIKEEILRILVMALVFICLKTFLFQGADGHAVAPQIEVSPVALSIGAKFGLRDFIENAYFMIGPLSRFTRFLFHTLIWNWLSTASLLVILISVKARRTIWKHAAIAKLILAFALASGFIYGLNIFDYYWSNLYLYKYTLAGCALFLGLIISELITSPTENKADIFAVLSWKTLTVFTLSLIPTYLFFNNLIGFIGSKEWKTDRVMNGTWRPKAFMSRDEFLAMQWIRKNLPSDAIIASDRKDKEGWSGNYDASVWFGYSAYSGKQFYNEGEDYNPYAVAKVSHQRWEQNKRLITARNPYEMSKAWANTRAGFIIISKRINEPTPTLENSSDIIFENSDILLLRNPHFSDSQKGVNF